MDNSTIKLHIDRMGKGYRVWTVPLIMVMWDVAFKALGSGNALTVVKELFSKPHFIIISIWLIVFGLVFDFCGKLLINALQDTEKLADISRIMHMHNSMADCIIVSPAVYYIAKAIVIFYSGGAVFSLSFIADIHGAICLLAVYDGIKSVKCNILIRQQLGF